MRLWHSRWMDSGLRSRAVSASAPEESLRLVCACAARGWLQGNGWPMQRQQYEALVEKARRNTEE